MRKIKSLGVRVPVAGLVAGVVAIDSGNHRARVRARRDELIETHLSLVEGIARSIARHLPPCFDLDDLVGVGNVALLHLATRYRPGEHGGAPFSAFARQGIRGAMLDSVRRKRYEEATRPSLDSVGEMGSNPGYDQRIDADRMAARLAEAMSWLPANQQRVLRAYYGADDPSFDEVSERLEFSSCTIRRRHNAAIDGLRDRFKRRAA